MRIGTFLAGGLIGAAAVYMMNGRVRGQLMSQMGKLSEANSNLQQSASHTSHGSSSELNGFKMVKQMISTDPELRQTIRDIVSHKEADTASASVPKL